MPARKQDGTRDQVIELAKAGHSARAIEGILAKRQVKFGKSAIAELVRLHRAGKVAGPAAKASAGKPSPKVPAAKAAPATPAPTPTAPATGPPPAAAPSMPGRRPDDESPLDPAEVADLDLEQLVALARLFDATLRSALAEKDTRVAGWVLGARRVLSQEIAKLRPPVIPDPDKDPANLAARDELRTRLERVTDAYQGSPAGLAQLRAHVARAEAAAERRGDPYEPREEPPTTPPEMPT
jgi:hypothetical protein